ncbi:MAG: methyltransferase [Candidatus Woesearchaeota archaeon]|nr:methyltransferase [Candidatus Woesearchaeota archaeon]
MPHYFSQKQDSLKLAKIRIVLKDRAFDLFSGSGVFSKDGLDVGSRFLIENCILGRSVLDLGCGIGVIGIALKLKDPGLAVSMVDINENAVAISKKNIKLYDLKIDIKLSDLYSRVDGKFDTILSNPPQSAGRKVCFEIIEKAPLYLNDSGTLQVVARHNKGGSVLEEKMQEVFGNVRQVAKGSGFRVYLSTKQ